MNTKKTKYMLMMLFVLLTLTSNKVFASNNGGYGYAFNTTSYANESCGYASAYETGRCNYVLTFKGYSTYIRGYTYITTPCSAASGLSSFSTIGCSHSTNSGTTGKAWIEVTSSDHYNPWVQEGGASTYCSMNRRIDATAPSCGTITINGKTGSSWLKAGSYTASMTATDSGVGFGGCGTSKTFTVGVSSGGGYKDVTFGIADWFGNRRDCSATFKFDGTAPGCSSSYVNNGWTNQNVYVQGYCSDGESGCAGSPSGWATEENQSVTLTCKDNVGNTRNTTTTVTNIDKTPPSCGAVSATRPTGGGWTKDPIPVNVGCWDSKSGCTQSSYTQMINGGWGTIGIADNAANTSSCNVSYDFFDGTAPSIQIKLDAPHEINSIEYQTSDNQVTVSISAADNQSGVDRTCYELVGATVKAPQCFAGSRIPDFNLTNDGKTIVKAWAFDKSYSYSNGYVYNPTTGGNRADASRDVYFDRIKPNATTELQKAAWLQSLNYDVTNTSETNWTNVPPLVQANTEDTPINKGTTYESRSGMGTVEWVWGLTNDPTKIWNSVDANRIYTDSNADGDTVPTIAMKGVYRISQVQATRVNAWNPQNSLPSSPELNDTVYLHARACDRAVGNYSHKQPNCSTAVIGPFKFDDIPPTLSEIFAKDNLGNDLSQHDWTNKLSIEFTGVEEEPLRDVSHPLGNTLRDTSGLDQMQLYYDTNSPHPSTLVKDETRYGNVDNYGTCESAKICSYKINFNDLKNSPNNNTSKVMTEGTRYVKTRVKDVAGNYTDKIFGPYRFDITGPTVTGGIEVTGEQGYFIP